MQERSHAVCREKKDDLYRNDEAVVLGMMELCGPGGMV